MVSLARTFSSQAVAGDVGAPRRSAPRIGRLTMLRVGVPLAILLVWEIAVRAGAIPVRFFPAPTSLIGEIWADLQSGKLVLDTLSSLYRLAWGLVIGIVLGVILGMAMGLSRAVDAALGGHGAGLARDPADHMDRLLHPVVRPRQSARDLPDRARCRLPDAAEYLCRRQGRWTSSTCVRPAISVRTASSCSRDVVLQAALPSILTGVRVSLGLGWILMVVGELIAVPAGLGGPR